MKNMYQYTLCGLSNIYIKNGYSIHSSAYGDTVSIHDMEGLHKAIGLQIVELSPVLNGEQIRFFRVEMDLAQASLASLLDVNESTIRNWEAGRSEIPRAADVTLRKLYSEYVNNNEKMTDLINRISKLNRDLDIRNIVLEETNSGWRAA